MSAEEMVFTACVRLICRPAPCEAELIDDRTEVDVRFRGSPYDDPAGLVRASLIAVRVIATHLELHVRGVTAEPWGRGRTLLDRDSEGHWYLA